MVFDYFTRLKKKFRLKKQKHFKARIIRDNRQIITNPKILEYLTGIIYFSKKFLLRVYIGLRTTFTVKKTKTTKLINNCE